MQDKSNYTTIMVLQDTETTKFEFTTNIGLEQIAAFFSYIFVILIAISLLVLLIQAACNTLQPAIVHLVFNSSKQD